jgi:lysophospholipase L1-like esterase
MPLLALVAGCGGGPTTVDQPPLVTLPTIACPADVADNVTTVPLTVSYAPPAVTGGTAPVSTTCTVPSGATFPSGTSDVICTATDAAQRTAQCVFHVTVTVKARLRGTKILAFGDSITEGETAQALVLTWHQYDPANSYPTVLQGLLQTRYPPQAADIVVVNAGVQGETAIKGADRLVDEVRRNGPDVLLLMEGSNDVNEGSSPFEISQAIRADIIHALQYGVKLVLVSTLLPEVRGRMRAFNPDGIDETNEAIRAAVEREGGTLVDAFSVFEPKKELLIGDDGLHPTVAGYKLLAETFAGAIAASFDASGAPVPQRFFQRPGPPSRALAHVRLP